jgi:DNA-binding GntR family transcriptional regulator
VEQNWDAVAAALRQRLAEREMAPKDLAEQSGVSETTVRELLHNTGPRRRQPRTLTAIAEALQWPPEHLRDVLRGEADEDIRTMRAHLEDLRAGLESMKRNEAIVAEMNQFHAGLAQRLAKLRGKG